MKYLSLFIAFTISAGLSAQTDLLTPEKLWQFGRVSLDDVSPDGKTTLYGVTYYDMAANKGNRDLYIAPVAGGTAKKITAFDGGEGNGQYSPDGQRIGFLRGGQLWEMNPDGTDQHRVSEESMNGFLYAPDGKRLLLSGMSRWTRRRKTATPICPKPMAALSTT